MAARIPALIISVMVLILSLLFLFSCEFNDAEEKEDCKAPDYNDDDDNDDNDAGDDDDSGPEDLPQWLLDRPYLQNRSLWAQTVNMDNRIFPRRLGCIGVGNGKVFGILGNQYPLATWHNFGGPHYQKTIKWFSDKEPWIYIDGKRKTADRQSISRVKSSAIVIVELENENLEWTSVNFAPHFPGEPMAEQAMISIWILRNIGEDPLGAVELEIDSNFGKYAEGNLRELLLDDRILNIRTIGQSTTAGKRENDIRIQAGALAPGEEIVFPVLYMFTTTDNDQPDEIFDTIYRAGTNTLLESTVQWWENWASEMTTFATPEEKFNDLLSGLAVAIKINQAATGGVSEMNQYAHTWLRDIHGPSVYYPLIGLKNDYKDMIDYLWGAILLEGHLANAFELNLDISDLPPQPDWENMGTMSGRTRAEGPSALILEYENYYKATGDLDLLEERYGMLRHALLKQQFVDGCLLHFSSDETFEDVMEVAFSENFINEPDESTLSAYSSLLMIRAAEFMATLADLLGYSTDAAEYQQLTTDVIDCFEDTYWMSGKGFYAVKAQTDTRVPFHRPYEDISTIPIWLSVNGLDESRVVENFESLMDILGHPNGTISSTVGWPYNLIFGFAKEGVQTGMSHAYWLNNLDKMFHPLADESFRRWQNVFSRAGFTDEAVIVDDYSHLAMLREPFSFVGDISSRFRSWESGLMGHAFLYHLTGFDYHLPEGWVKLAPHLPPEWNKMEFFRLPYGAGRFDLAVFILEKAGRMIEIQTDSNASFSLDLTVPVDGNVSGILLDGTPLPVSNYDVEQNDYGRWVVRFDPIQVPANTVMEILIQATK